MIARAASAGKRCYGLLIGAGLPLSLVLLPVAASAQHISDAQAVAAFKKMQGNVALLTHEKSRLQDVRLAVATDCHEKAGSEATASFCYCAGLVTVALWYGDKGMRDRLDAFSASTSGDPRDFLRYQGPELYAPFCHKVVAGMATAAH